MSYYIGAVCCSAIQIAFQRGYDQFIHYALLTDQERRVREMLI